MFHRWIFVEILLAKVFLAALITETHFQSVLADCARECKLHNRFCEGEDSGARYFEVTGETAHVALKVWSQAPDGGTAIELDLFDAKYYNDCVADCEDVFPTTGSPFGTVTSTGQIHAGRKCKPEEPPTE